MRFAFQRAAAFTLLELMMVLGIIAICFGVAVPAFVRSQQRAPLQQAVQDLMEGLKQARATAILTGSPADFILRLEDRTISVQAVSGAAAENSETRLANAAPKGFTAQLSDELNLELLAVNFRDLLAASDEEARVRFQPNGTSDEFTIVLRSPDNQWRKISLEIVTGLASLEVNPQKFLKQ
jgi:type II secretion system protein H